MIALEAAPENKILEWYNFHKLGFYEASRAAHYRCGVFR